MERAELAKDMSSLVLPWIGSIMNFASNQVSISPKIHVYALYVYETVIAIISLIVLFSHP